MKSLSKKLLGIAMAATMVFACSATALAAPRIPVIPEPAPVSEPAYAVEAEAYSLEPGDLVDWCYGRITYSRRAWQPYSSYLFAPVSGTYTLDLYNIVKGQSGVLHVYVDGEEIAEGATTVTLSEGYHDVYATGSRTNTGAAITFDLDLIYTPDASVEEHFTAEQLRQMSVTTFVESLYVKILDRTYDPTGRDAWFSTLMENGTATAVVSGFLNSAEFSAKNMSNEEFVAVCYSVFCNRTASAAEVASWVEALNNGATRADVVSGFAASPEWATICGYFCVNV